MQGGENYLIPAPDNNEGLITQETHTDTANEDDVSNVYREILPTSNDILLGRGAFINEHIGNRKFRKLALTHKLEFDSASPADRRAIAEDIIQITRGKSFGLFSVLIRLSSGI